MKRSQKPKAFAQFEKKGIPLTQQQLIKGGIGIMVIDVG